jgi:adenosylcobinamide-phosphate synthase
MNLLIAYLIDLILGDPANMPHPVRYIGKWIQTLEKKLLNLNDTPENQKTKGIFLVIGTVLVVFCFYTAVVQVAYMANLWLGRCIEIFVLYQMLATKCLAFEGMRIFKALKEKDLERARTLIGYLVSRETSEMSEEDIIKATIETVTENIIDGVVAPMCFAIIGGAPLGMAYKAANTLDSMVGYKNERYMYFGWASAKFDDVLNWLPARFTGGLVIIAAFISGLDANQALQVLIRDRHNHASPNSPYAEAPAAGALRIQLGGRATYFGVTYDKPTFGDALETIKPYHIKKAVSLLYVTSALAVLTLTGIYMSVQLVI